MARQGLVVESQTLWNQIERLACVLRSASSVAASCYARSASLSARFLFAHLLADRALLLALLVLLLLALVREAQGRAWIWLGMRKQTGRGGPESGLGFDRIVSLPDRARAGGG